MVSVIRYLCTLDIFVIFFEILHCCVSWSCWGILKQYQSLVQGISKWLDSSIWMLAHLTVLIYYTTTALTTNTQSYLNPGHRSKRKPKRRSLKPRVQSKVEWVSLKRSRLKQLKKTHICEVCHTVWGSTCQFQPSHPWSLLLMFSSLLFHHTWCLFPESGNRSLLFHLFGLNIHLFRYWIYAWLALVIILQQQYSDTRAL